MRLRRIALVAAAALFVLVPSSTGAGPPQEVSIEFSDYRPSQLDLLPGETVLWTNVSTRTHTVTSDTGLFDSSDLPGGSHFNFQFNEVGAYLYHCVIHPSITGEIDVRRVILGTFPTAVVKVGHAGRHRRAHRRPVEARRHPAAAWRRRVRDRGDRHPRRERRLEDDAESRGDG